MFFSRQELPAQFLARNYRYFVFGASNGMPKHFNSTGETKMQTTNYSHLLNRREAAAYLTISQRKLDSLVDSGEILRVKIGTCVRFDLADLIRFVEERKNA